MKTTNKILLVFFILILAGITVLMVYLRIKVGQAEFVAESGIIVTEEITIENFNKLEVSGNIRLTLIRGDLPGLTITGDENLIPLLTSDLRKGTLKINSPRSSRRQRQIEAELYYVSFDELSTSGGSRVNSTDTITADMFQLSVLSGSFCDLVIVAEKLDIKALAGSHADIAGKVGQVIIESVAGAQVQANNLEAVKANIKTSAGASVSIHVLEDLDASASSGSLIRYSGNPGLKNVSSSSGGSVSKQ